jgi:hypothetical protein
VGLQRIVFNLCTPKKDIWEHEVKVFDEYISDGITHVVGQPLTLDQRLLWSLPVNDAGMGTAVAANIADTAFLASVNGSLNNQLALGVSSPRREFQQVTQRLAPLMTNHFDGVNVYVQNSQFT